MASTEGGEARQRIPYRAPLDGTARPRERLPGAGDLGVDLASHVDLDVADEGPAVGRRCVNGQPGVVAVAVSVIKSVFSVDARREGTDGARRRAQRFEGRTRHLARAGVANQDLRVADSSAEFRPLPWTPWAGAERSHWPRTSSACRAV